MTNVQICFDYGEYSREPALMEESDGLLSEPLDPSQWINAVRSCDILVTGRPMIQNYSRELQSQFSEVCKLDTGDILLLNSTRTVEVRHSQVEGRTEVLCRFTDFEGESPLVVFSFVPDPNTPAPKRDTGSAAELLVQVAGQAKQAKVSFVNNRSVVWEGRAHEEPSNYKLVKFARPTPVEPDWCTIA
jgi:hypothetical protein